MPFDQLGLSDKVLAAVATSGYTTPTPIQEQAIPHMLSRRDVLGIAQTGTGKTAAFTLPMLTLLEKGRARARMPRTLILEPTRELAAQVEESFDRYGKNHKLNVALLIGGVSYDDQDLKLTRGVDVLIATPGRLLDHFERGRLLLSGIEILVIDEADRMLDMGFIPDIERICKLVPFTRQTLFFSATMPPEIQRLVGQFLHNPVKVEVSRPATTVATTSQLLVSSGADPAKKREVLRKLIRSEPNLKNGIIFCNRKTEVAKLHRSLVRHGFSAIALHGDMDQRSRTNALEILPQWRGDAADRERRRRPRSRHSRRQPRVQFRYAPSRRRLCAQDRAYGPRGQEWRGHHHHVLGGRQIACRDREADRPEDPLEERNAGTGRIAAGDAARAPAGRDSRATGQEQRTRAAPRSPGRAVGPHAGTVASTAYAGPAAHTPRAGTVASTACAGAAAQHPARRSGRQHRIPQPPTFPPSCFALCR